MASAKKVNIPVVVEPPYKIVLELSQEEAEVLLAVTRHIGGHPSTSHRKYTDNIQRALYNAEVGINSKLNMVGSIECKSIISE